MNIAINKTGVSISSRPPGQRSQEAYFRQAIQEMHLEGLNCPITKEDLEVFRKELFETYNPSTSNNFNSDPNTLTNVEFNFDLKSNE